MLPNDFKLAGISFFYSDAIALLQHSPIHRLLYSFPNIRFQQFRIPYLRINTVAEEYIHQAVIRVYPCTSSGKARIPYTDAGAERAQGLFAGFCTSGLSNPKPRRHPLATVVVKSLHVSLLK